MHSLCCAFYVLCCAVHSMCYVVRSLCCAFSVLCCAVHSVRYVVHSLCCVVMLCVRCVVHSMCCVVLCILCVMLCVRCAVHSLYCVVLCILCVMLCILCVVLWCAFCVMLCVRCAVHSMLCCAFVVLCFYVVHSLCCVVHSLCCVVLCIQAPDNRNICRIRRYFLLMFLSETSCILMPKQNAANQTRSQTTMKHKVFVHFYKQLYTLISLLKSTDDLAKKRGLKFCEDVISCVRMHAACLREPEPCFLSSKFDEQLKRKRMVAI